MFLEQIDTDSIISFKTSSLQQVNIQEILSVLLSNGR